MEPECTPDGTQGATVSECLTPEQLEEAPDRYFCPISLDMMTDPVLLVSTGQTYEYNSLMTWFESGRILPLTKDMTGVTNECPATLPSQNYKWSNVQAVHAGGRNCPMTGLHLSGKVTLKVDVALRDEIGAWLRARGKNPDAIRNAVLLARHGGRTDDCGEHPCSCMQLQALCSRLPLRVLVVYSHLWLRA